MSDEKRSKAWMEGYSAYMYEEQAYNTNPYAQNNQEQKDWSDGYLEAQYEVEASFGEEDVA